MNSWALHVVLLAWLAARPPTAAAQASTPPGDDIPILLHALEQVAVGGQPARYLDLVSPAADREAASRFAEENLAGRTEKAVIRERDRQPLAPSAGQGYRVTVAALLAAGNQGRLLTWELDVRRESDARDANGARWTIAGQRRLSSLDNLYHLALDSTRQFQAQNLVLTAEDFELHFPRGSVFVATARGKPTAWVLLGKGDVVFSPAPVAEREQLRIFSGSEVLRTSFDACMVRINPDDLENRTSKALTERAVDAGELARARQLFADDAPRSYTLDIGDLDPGPWSIIPAPGDWLAELHTGRFGQLTYARTASEPEDVTLFDRLRRRTIALYASREKLASRGPFFDEDGKADYTVSRYDVNASFDPSRQLIEGRTRLLLRVRAPSLTTIKLRLADSLVVRSASASGFGRVAAVRVRGQDTVMLSLPATLTRDAQLDVTIAYAGRLPPANSATPVPAAQPGSRTPQPVPVEPSALYTVPVAWYAQAPTTAYAPATLRLTVPAPYSCVASGELSGRAEVLGDPVAGLRATSFTFIAERPVPYLACLISRLLPVAETAAGGNSPRVTAVANQPVEGQARLAARQAEEILRFYASVLGEPPYPTLTLALVEGPLPGGNSQAYLAVLNQQAAMSPLNWRNDPAAFPDFPEFFIAHEIAHQWWGLAVGSKNYHEQWLSEGFAQYFAVLYAEHAHGRTAFESVMKRMQAWAERSSGNGPIYLGGRIGQLQQDSRVFRAVVYDKGAIVLHMLRRLVGDQAFFDGLRTFYMKWRFKKAGTDDLRQAIEATSGMKLERFFERWVYADTLPHVKFSWKTTQVANGQAPVVRFEQLGEVFDVPVTVTIEFADRRSVDVVVPVTDRVVERQLDVAGRVRDVAVNRDDLVLGEISRR